MNPALPRIYLVRHGDTAWTLTARHTGRTDLPLSEQGERQARELRASLTGLRFDRILSSPLQRARRTAELAMPRTLVEADDDLMEWDYSAYEGRSTVDIEVERPGWRLLRDGSPGGETLDAVGARHRIAVGRGRRRPRGAKRARAGQFERPVFPATPGAERCRALRGGGRAGAQTPGTGGQDCRRVLQQQLRAVLEAAGITRLFDARVDGTDITRLELEGKPGRSDSGAGPPASRD